MPKEGDLRFNERWHKYSVYKEGRWYNPPSFSKIKKQLNQPWAIGYGARCTAEYLINEVIPLIISGDLKLTKADLLSEDFNGLLKTAKRQPQIDSDREAGIGKESHSALQRYILTGEKPIGLSDRAQNAFNSYILWESANKDSIGETLFMETPLYCKEHDFCFTPDRAFMFNGGLTYQDFKSGKQLYDLDLALQDAAYIMGMEENINNGTLAEYGLTPGTKFATGGGLWLDKTNGTKAIWKDYKVWLPTATLIFVLLRDMLELTTQFNKISGLTY